MDNSDQRCAIKLKELHRELRIKTDGILEGAKRLFNQSRGLFVEMPYKKIRLRQKEPSWLRVMRENNCNIVHATRLGPDGENFYEPYKWEQK